MVWYSLADTKETQNSANLVLLVMDPLWQDLVELLLEPPEEKMELWDIAEWKDSCSRGNEDEPDWWENVTWLKSRGFCSWKLVICKNVTNFLHLKEIQAKLTSTDALRRSPGSEVVIIMILQLRQLIIVQVKKRSTEWTRRAGWNQILRNSVSGRKVVSGRNTVSRRNTVSGRKVHLVEWSCGGWWGGQDVR